MDDRTQRNGKAPNPFSKRVSSNLAAHAFQGKQYHGTITAEGVHEVWAEETRFDPVANAVKVEGRRPLPLHLDIKNHSPAGFAWGYGGSGPAQLALALLIDATEDIDLAEELYQEFKREVISSLGQTWTLTRREIQAFVAKRQRGGEP